MHKAINIYYTVCNSLQLTVSRTVHCVEFVIERHTSSTLLVLHGAQQGRVDVSLARIQTNGSHCFNGAPLPNSAERPLGALEQHPKN
jgi:hypothetical protein